MTGCPREMDDDHERPSLALTIPREIWQHIIRSCDYASVTALGKVSAIISSHMSNDYWRRRCLSGHSDLKLALDTLSQDQDMEDVNFMELYFGYPFKLETECIAIEMENMIRKKRKDVDFNCLFLYRDELLFVDDHVEEGECSWTIGFDHCSIPRWALERFNPTLHIWEHHIDNRTAALPDTCCEKNIEMTMTVTHRDGRVTEERKEIKQRKVVHNTSFLSWNEMTVSTRGVKGVVFHMKVPRGSVIGKMDFELVWPGKEEVVDSD